MSKLRTRAYGPLKPLANTPTPVPTDTQIPEATPTPAPTSAPETTFVYIYRIDVEVGLRTSYVVYHSRSQAALDRVTTAATTGNESNTVEYMKSA